MMPDNILEQIQIALDVALQSDLEHGVKWMNEAYAEKFKADYPQLNQVIENIMEMKYG